MLADVAEPLLDDPEDFDLLVRREADRRIDLEVDCEGAVGGEELDIPMERRVEGCRPARRGEFSPVTTPCELINSQ